MRRRDFLKYSSLVVPAAAVMGTMGTFTNKIFAAEKSQLFSGKTGMFSLSVITDQPSRTIHLMEQIIKNSRYGSGDLDFSEYKLEGIHTGDIAYVKSGKLIDYHKGTDDFSMMLNESAGSLKLPRSLDNPVMLRFSSQLDLSSPGIVNIFRGDSMIKQLSIDKDVDHYRVEGSKGHVEISIKNKNVKIVSSTCKHKTCMTMGPAARPGDNLICIPNQISVAVAGKNSLGIDSITF